MVCHGASVLRALGQQLPRACVGSSFVSCVGFGFAEDGSAATTTLALAGSAADGERPYWLRMVQTLCRALALALPQWHGLFLHMPARRAMSCSQWAAGGGG